MDSNLEYKEKQILLKKYLSLDNVSFLAGAGTSFHLGTPVIRTIPDELKKDCKTEIEKYFPKNEEPSFEDLFNCLQAEKYLENKKKNSTSDLDKTMQTMQKWLFENCNTEITKIRPPGCENDTNLQTDRYYYHERFIKKILQRPNNLKRVNLFTTNYDMAFDYALDNLGVHYINGFMGVHNRCFRPEIYDYDLYYPGQSVSGKVHRAERVIKYYKMHGSLSWVSTEPNFHNTYGIREIPLSEYKFNEIERLMIYPCVSKKTYTLDLPYSELFRQFSQAINQPQSVLFCIGYSFYDEHINDIIYQALAIPSFTLIIVNYSENKDENSPIAKLAALRDKRIIILDEQNEKISTFCGFVENILPDLYEEDDNLMIAETMQKLYPNNNKKDDNNDTAQ